MSMYEVIGTNKPDYLLSSPEGADKIAVPVKPGNGTVKRGTILYRDDTGMYVPAAAAEAVDGKFLVVLDETVDTTKNASVAEDAAAYRAGKLARGKVMTKDGAAATAAIELVLRKQGIMIEQTETTKTFKNTTP